MEVCFVLFCFVCEKKKPTRADHSSAPVKATERKSIATPLLKEEKATCLSEQKMGPPKTLGGWELDLFSLLPVRLRNPPFKGSQASLWGKELSKVLEGIVAGLFVSGPQVWQKMWEHTRNGNFV